MLRKGILALVLMGFVGGNALAAAQRPVSSARPTNLKKQPRSSAKPVAFKHGLGARPIGPQHFDDEPTFLDQGPSRPVSSARPTVFKKGEKSKPVSSAKPIAFKHGRGARPIGPQHFDYEPALLDQGPSKPVSSAKPTVFKKGAKSKPVSSAKPKTFKKA